MSKQLDFFEDTKATWLLNARAAALRIARETGKVCADDLHKAMPIPNYIDGRIMGSVFKGMKFLHYKKSERKECHFRPIGVFTI